MQKVSLTQSKFALVDDEDFNRVNLHKWFFHSGYACRTQYMGGGAKHRINKLRTMHRFIIGNPPLGKEIDHVNMNKLDNRKCNLRFCTRSENKQNGGVYITNKSGKKGVRQHYLKWEARITKNYHTYYLGLFNSKNKAVLAYAQACHKLHGEFGRITI
jgi:hypothetical protein